MTARLVTPFLMFQGDAEAAIDLYVAAIPQSEILDLQRYGKEGPGAEGKVMMARVRLGGLEIMCNDSSIAHDFTFTPSSSLYVACASESELDGIAATLAEGGQFLMPVGNYGFSRRFAWLADRFGVSWQLDCP